MPLLVLLGLAAVLLWALVSHRFERWGVAGPALLLALGAATTVWDLPKYAAAIEAPATEKVVELILSLLLFADATEVRGGVFGSEAVSYTHLDVYKRQASMETSTFALGS